MSSFAPPHPSWRPPAPGGRAGPNRLTVVLRPDGRLDLAGALALADIAARYPEARFPRTILIQDVGYGGDRPGPSRLTEAALDRLACLAPGASTSLVVASRVPAIARLALLVAGQVRPPDRAGYGDSCAWFGDVLVAAGLLAARATHAAIEGDKGDDLSLTRCLAGRLAKAFPGLLPPPVPARSGHPSYLALDGKEPMGASTRGTLFLADPPEVVRRKIRSARTDARPAFLPGEEVAPEVANLLLLLHATSGVPARDLVRDLAGRGYAHLKDRLAAAVESWLGPVRARRDALVAGEDTLAERMARDGASLEDAAAELADALTRRPELLAA